LAATRADFIFDAFTGKLRRSAKGMVRLMRRALFWLVLVAAASMLPAHWAQAQFKNEGMGVLLPPTRGIPHPGSAPSYTPLPSPAPSAPAAADPVPAPPPATKPPPPAASSTQPAK
jgi:hypothetical protein